MKLTAKIGVLQLTDDRFRLIVIKTGSAAPKVLERIDEPLPSGQGDIELTRVEQATFIRSIIKKLNHVPALYLLNAPHSWSVMRLLSVPFKGANKVRAAITFELEPYLAIPIDDLMVDHNSVSEVGNKTEVFIMGLQRDPVAKQLDILEEAGILIEGIGLDIVGLSALTLDTLIADSTPHAMVIEHKGHAFVTVVHNKCLAYAQRINSTPDRPDAWAQEIQNTLRAFHANSLATVELSGVVCTYTRLTDEARSTLESKLNIPVAAATLGTGWAPDAILNLPDTSTWLSMIGTGSAAAGGSFNISFRAAARGETAAANPYRVHLATVAALVLFTVLAHLFITYTKTRNNLAETAQLGQVVWEDFAATYPNNPLATTRPPGDLDGAQSYNAMLEAIEEEQSRSANLTLEMFNKPSLLNILKELSAHMPDTEVNVIEMNMTDPRRKRLEIKVRGETRNPTAFGKVTEGLKQSEILEIAKQTRSTIEGKESFELIVYVKSNDSAS